MRVSGPPPAERGSRLATVTIRPSRGIARLNLKELWDYRELLYFLTWRDVKVRYKQTFFGAGWAIIQPLLLMAVFSIFLGRLAGVPSDGLPYPLFAFAALVPWTFFAQVLSGASASLVNSSHLISKVYFPRMLLPLASAGSFIVDVAIATLVLLGLMLFYDLYPSVRILWIPLLVALALLAAIAVGIWLAALNVRYRDVRYAVPFLVQLWLFASPVAYSTSIVPERWQTLYGLNPMAGVVQGFRWAMTGAGDPPGRVLFVSVGATLVILGIAVTYFRRVESTFADEI